MRETITIAVCLLLAFVGLQTGFLRTGMDYDNLQKKFESLQTANDRLSQELRRMPQSGGLVSTDVASANDNKQIEELKAELEHYRTRENGHRQPLQELKAKWMKALDREIKEGNCDIKDEDDQMVIALRDVFLFKSETEALNRPAQELLTKMGAELREQKDLEIRVLAHTDLIVDGKNLEERNSKAQILAAARAQALSRFLDSTGGIDPVQLSYGSCGPNRPVAANDSEYHRAQNRRFELWITPVNPRLLNQARKIVHFEKQFKGTAPQPTARPVKRKSGSEEGSAQPLGAEALDQDDSTNFQGGYEKPGE